MRALLLLSMLALLAACGATEEAGGGGEQPATPSPTPPATAAPGGEIRGALGGDAQLEGGCAWVDADDGTRFEVVYPEGYSVRFDPLQLVGPDGSVVAEEGDRVVVPGAAAEDMVSVCQVGPLWQADDVRPEGAAS